MTDLWYQCPEFTQFPPLYRAWVSWCAHAPKRQTGTWGGSQFFKLVRTYYRHFPVGDDNLIPISLPENPLEPVVDILDLQTAIFTVPGFRTPTSEHHFLRRMLPRITTFVDIGANFGLFGLIAAQTESVGVYAFEPQPRPFRALELARDRNRLGNLELSNVAVADRVGETSFHVPRMASGSGSVFQEHAGRKAQRIDVRTVSLDSLDTIPWADGPILIKIDVEGAELRVLEGSRRLLEEHRPFLWFEVNPSALGAADLSIAEIRRFLAPLGYHSLLDLKASNQGVRAPIGETVPHLTNVITATTDREEALLP